MITRRTLKKRSKLAVPILIAHFRAPADGFWKSERERDYHGTVIRCTHGAGDPSTVEGRPNCECSNHPLPGTPMCHRHLMNYGGGSDECDDGQTALEALQDAIAWSEKPDTMTEAEWRRAIRIARVRPYNEAEFRAWMKDCDDARHDVF